MGNVSAGRARRTGGIWMWLLERFVPVVEGDVSTLDIKDGVGSATLVASPDARTPAPRRAVV